MSRGALQTANGSRGARGVHRTSSRFEPMSKETDSNGDHASIDGQNNSGTTPVEYTTNAAYEFGFSICEPGYSKAGRLPIPGAPHNRTEIDIIAIPAIAASSTDVWNTKSKANETYSMWITRDIRKEIPEARVLVYKGLEFVKQGDTLATLARDLLESLHKLRGYDREKRPLFFICHSTGGLVCKKALIDALKGNDEDKLVVADCYGISFFATPHLGSSYLSRDEFADTICRELRLHEPLPLSLRREFGINHNLVLRDMASPFRSLAADLKVWTFYETEDTDLTRLMPRGQKNIPLLAPIASIKSAFLDLYHEDDYPLLGTHRECASFCDGGSEDVKTHYLSELKKAVKKAHELSKIPHHDLKLEEKVKIEVHGFYEGIIDSAEAKRPITLWSTKTPLRKFLDKGPSKCLQDRLDEEVVPPKDTQVLSQTGARAKSLDPSTANGEDLSKVSPMKGPPDDRLKPSNGMNRLLPKSEGSFIKNAFSKPSKTNEDTTKRNLKPFPPRPPAVKRLSQTASPPNLTDVAEEQAAPGAPTTALADEAALLEREGGITNVAVVSTVSPYGRRSSGVDSIDFASTQVSLSSPHSESGESHETTAEIFRVPNTSFRRPDVRDRKLTWIHVPFNNPAWVADVLGKACKDLGSDYHEKLLDPKFWASKHVRTRHSEHHTCFVKPCCMGLPHETESLSPVQGIEGNEDSPPKVLFSLFMPYLHWDTYKLLIKRRELIKKRYKHGRSRPVPEDVAKMDLEYRMIWDYSGFDPPYNCRRTLDQFGYPNLHDSRARDDDQMLYKRTKDRPSTDNPDDNTRKRSEKLSDRDSETEQQDLSDTDSMSDYDSNAADNVLDGTVLMVDQLWLWALGNETTVTFFPRRQSCRLEGRKFQQADLRDSIYFEVNGDFARRCEDSLDLAALVVLHAVTVLFEKSSHGDLEVFRIFEESISMLIETMTKSFKDFRFQKVGYNKQFDDCVENSDTRAQYANKQNADDLDAMLELRDIQDELHSLERLFQQQKDTLEQMIEIYNEERFKKITTNAMAILREAMHKLLEYQDQVKHMVETAKGTREDFEKLLDLKQRQANLDEARLAHQQADIAGTQSRAVLVFTVFTVFFLPLTFFTGLFGMNISDWSGVPTNVSWVTVVKWAIPLSLVIILSALILALSRRARMVFERLIDHAWGLVGLILGFIYFTRLPQMLERLKRRMAAPTSKQSLPANTLQDSNHMNSYDSKSDYWKKFDNRSTKEHQIPPQNLKPRGYRKLKKRLTQDLFDMKRTKNKTTGDDPNVQSKSKV